MTSRVMLISPAISAALREARFDDGCPVDAAGLRLAETAAGSLPAPDRALVSPGVRCRETAAALGLDAAAESELAGLDVGRWRGATLAEVSADEPEAVARWLADPSYAPHGGESVRGADEVEQDQHQDAEEDRPGDDRADRQLGRHGGRYSRSGCGRL
ncbi:hypothetical protein G5C60_28290, partial [Streptomyces sp. HC44]